jgi:hypothetical protein
MATVLYWIVQADATATPTGAQIVAGQDGTGSAALAAGSEAYTAAGDYSEAIAISGLSANTAYEQAWVAYDGSTYSSVVTATITTPANVSNALTGQAVTISAGTMVAALAQALTGSSATASAGTLAQALTQHLVGSAATASAGTLVSAITQPLTGSAVTASAGTLTANVGTGNEAALTGSAVTASTGTLVTALTQPLTGESATVSAGTATAGVTQPLTGSAVTASAGTLTASVDTNVTVALAGATVSVIAGDISKLGGMSAAIGGGGGPAPRRRKFVHRVGDRLYVTTDEEEAEALAEQEEAEEAAEQVIAKAKTAPKPLRKIAETVEIPDFGIDIGVIRDMAAEQERARQLDQMIKREQYDRVVALYARMLQDQDDEDVLLLMTI